MRWGGALVVSVVLAPPAAAADIDSLLAALESPDAVRRDRAVKGLSALGPEALPQIFDLVAMRLVRHANPEGMPGPIFEQLLAETARGLAGQDPTIAPRLARYTIEGQRHEAEISGRALLLMGDRARGARPVLARGLESADFGTRFQAMKILVAVDGPGYPALLAAMKSPRADTRESAAKGLGETHSAVALEPLIAALGDDEEAVRYAASEALAELGAVAASAVPRLVALDAVEAFHLARIGEAAIPALVAGLQGGAPNVSAKAGQALGILGGRAAGPALDAIVAGLDHKSALVRTTSAAALESAARSDAPHPDAAGKIAKAAPRLTALSRDPDPKVRTAAVGALSRIDSGPSGLEVLLAVAGDADPTVAARALAGLGEYATFRSIGATQVVPVLRRSLSAKDARIRLGALSGIGGLHLQDSRPLKADLERLAQSDNDAGVRAKADGLVRMISGLPPATPAPR
jgi:HEAT repeat protein